MDKRKILIKKILNVSGLVTNDIPNTNILKSYNEAPDHAWLRFFSFQEFFFGDGNLEYGISTTG